MAGKAMTKNQKDSLIVNAFREIATNVMALRANLLNKLFDPRRDIDEECGYPADITPQQYRAMYDREGVAARIVNLWPDESWVKPPTVYESEDGDETEFEEAWQELVDRLHIYNALHLVDRLSGVGRYGVILLGIKDGENLTAPVKGLDAATGDPVGEPMYDPEKLLYLRVFDENSVQIDTRESNPQSPRFGKPTMYSINIEDSQVYGDTTASKGLTTSLKVHWTRIIHIADNKESSEVYGVPRLKVLFNRAYDVKKILSGSGEMFWRGAFPGLSIEATPGDMGVELDVEGLREQMEAYMNKLQRYIAVAGGSVKSLAPQIADPAKHLEAQIDFICLTLGVPKRIFLGSERGELASSQDSRAWNTRVSARQENYVTPMLIRPFVQRLMDVGALPRLEKVLVDWPDLNTVTDEDKAKVGLIRTQAMAAYVAGDVDSIAPPKEYLTIVMEMDVEEVEQMLEAADDFQEDRDEKRIHDAEMTAEANKIVAEATPQPEEGAPSAARGARVRGGRPNPPRR